MSDPVNEEVGALIIKTGESLIDVNKDQLDDVIDPVFPTMAVLSCQLLLPDRFAVLFGLL